VQSETALLQDRDISTRNQSSPFADAAIGARLLRGRPSRYKLVRGLGRGVKVCSRRRGTAGGWIGFAMVVGGIGAVGWESVLKEFSWGRVGTLLIVCGAMVAIYAKLKVRTEGNSETYRLGYDIGYEAGHQEGHKQARPVLVDMEARRRCTCGAHKSNALTPAGSVVDRG